MTQDRGYEAARAEREAFERKGSLVAVLVMLVVYWVAVIL